MSDNTFGETIENSCVTLPTCTQDVNATPWQPHAAFKGVFLRDLVLGAHTQGDLSCHMVRVEPGASLETHQHPTQTELHEVISGSGVCTLEGKAIAYTPGAMAVITKGYQHRVQAGDQGLLLLAKFCPAIK